MYPPSLARELLSGDCTIGSRITSEIAQHRTSLGETTQCRANVRVVAMALEVNEENVVPRLLPTRPRLDPRQADRMVIEYLERAS
jgi:hypothetical protein